MSCKNKVKVWIHRGFTSREVEYNCGETDVRGNRIMCEECEEKAKRMYPQGWRNVPGDICPHGKYIGDAYGPDYICSQCEDGQ